MSELDLLGRDKVALITGGACGIGREVARVFGRAGWRLVLADLKETEGYAAAAELIDAGIPAIFVQTDVVESSQVEVAVEAALATWDRLDFVFNGAGISGQGAPIEELDEDDLQRVINVNLLGAFHVSKHAVRAQKARGGGGILHVSSIVAETGSAYYTAYSSTKAGVAALTRGLARNVGRYNIRINCLQPGSVSGTRLMARERERKSEETLRREQMAQLRRIPLGRTARPCDVAHFALFLASPLAAHIHGAVLTIDGGEALGFQ